MMKRRDFLASSLSAVAGAAAWRSNRLPAVRIRFGYAAITWNGKDRQAIEDIAALGFHGIQLRQSAFDAWGDRPAELKELLAQKNLVLVALSSGNVSLDPATEKNTLAQHALHGQFVRDVGGRYLQVIDERPHGAAPSPEDYRRMGRLLTEIGRRSSDLGIPLGYHNHMGALRLRPCAATQAGCYFCTSRTSRGNALWRWGGGESTSRLCSRRWMRSPSMVGAWWSSIACRTLPAPRKNRARSRAATSRR